MERSREKSNIPRPSTFNISSQDGRRAGRRVDWEIKQEDFQRGTRWLCSTPAAIRRRDGNLTEAVWCALVFSSTCAKCWKISTCWMTAKKIMESERASFFFFFMFYECTCLDDLHLSAGNYIKNDRDCTLPMDSAEVPFFALCLKCSFTCRKHFDWSLFFSFFFSSR